MKAWSSYFKDRGVVFKFSATPQEWQSIVTTIWNDVENLDERNIANFLLALKKVGIEP